MKVLITYGDASTRLVEIPDPVIIGMAERAADVEDALAHDRAKKRITKVEGSTAAIQEVS